MHNIFRYQIIILFAFIAFGSYDVQAQFTARDNYNYLDFANKPYYFGMSFGYNRAGYRIDKSKSFVNSQNINVVESLSGPGVTLQMIANLKIGDYFDFRALPGFSFSERKFVFTSNTAEATTYDKSIESVYFTVPFQIRFKSAPYKDKRLYMMAGLNYSYDVQSNSRLRPEEQVDLILTSPHDFSIEYGAGLQIFYPYFIFSPEIKISQGISNIHIFKDDLEESSILEVVKSRIFSISFHFEG